MTARLRISRRRLLRVSAAALGAVPWIVPRTAFGANDRITMGCIGMGGQGRGDMSGFLGFPEVQVLLVCDVVADHRNQAKAIVDDRCGNSDCAVTSDFREVLGRGDTAGCFPAAASGCGTTTTGTIGWSAAARSARSARRL